MAGFEGISPYQVESEKKACSDGWYLWWPWRSCRVDNALYGCVIRLIRSGDRIRVSVFYLERRFDLCKICWRRCLRMGPALELLCLLQWPGAYGNDATGWGSANLPGTFMRLVSKLWHWFMSFGRFTNKKQGIRFDGHQFVGLHAWHILQR